MKNRISILTILLMTAIFSNSCEKMDAVSDKTTNRRIIPTVTTKDLTKSHGQDTPIETMVFKAGDYDIVQTVYDWDSPTSSTIGTKAILTDGNLAAFKTYQYYSNGGRLHFEDTATKSGSTWSFSTDHKWTTEPTVFWSYAGDAAGPADITTSAEGLTANLTASYDDDFIVAYNVERGRDNDVTHSSGDSEDKLNVTFQHAMSLVEFTAEGLPDEEFKITDITVSSVEGGVDKGLVSTSTLSVPASTPLTFTHTPGTGREQLTYTGGNLKKGDITSFIVIPQTVEKLKIDYTIAFVDGSTPRTVTRSATVSDVTFDPGKRYVLKLGLKLHTVTYSFKGDDWSCTRTIDGGAPTSTSNYWTPGNFADYTIDVNHSFGAKSADAVQLSYKTNNKWYQIFKANGLYGAGNGGNTDRVALDGSLFKNGGRAVAMDGIFNDSTLKNSYIYDTSVR